MPGLNLSGADTSGFEVPSGPYDAVIERAEMKETKGGPDAKLPAGTPMLNIGFKITDEGENEGKWLWRSYIIAPEKVDGKKYENKAKMDGMLARFLVAVGYDLDDITSGSFDLDVEDLLGRPCRVVTKLKPDGSNDVTGVKPVGEGATAGSGLL